MLDRESGNIRGGGILIHEIHDMWPLSPMEINGMPKYHPFIVLMQMAENSFCRHSDCIVSLLPAAKEYLMEHGMEESKFSHVANGVVKEEWETYEPLPDDVQKKINDLKSHDRILICFFGSHLKTYSVDYIIDAVKRFDGEKVGLLFVGDGMYKSEMMKRAGNVEYIQFVPPVPKTCIPELLKQIDVSYVGAVDKKMLRFGICMNKLFDAMMGGKPILYAVNAPNNYIEDFKCGITVQPENTDALEDGIRTLLAMSAEERKKMGDNGRRAVLEHFTYEKLAERFIGGGDLEINNELYYKRGI